MRPIRAALRSSLIGLRPSQMSQMSWAMRRLAGAHFIDLHYVLAAAMGDPARFDKRVSELEALHANGRLAPGNVAVEMCKGAHAMAAGDNAAAIRILEPLMPDVVRIGGSHAQRELWEDMLIVACLRSGEMTSTNSLRRIAARLVDPGRRFLRSPLPSQVL